MLIVDDHELVRAAFRVMIERMPGFSVAGEAGTVSWALDCARKLKPDLVLLDLHLPGPGGLELLRRLRAELPELRVLVVTMFDDAAHLSRALAAGAHGYLTKDAPPALLRAALEAVAAGKRFIEPRLADGAAAGADALARLTPREFEVFELLAGGKSVPEVARTLHLSPKTVYVHRSQVLAKLGVDNEAQLARLALQLGLLPESQPDREPTG